MFHSILILSLIIVISTCYILKRKSTYWKRRGVPYLEPFLIFGNYKPYILLKKHFGHVAHDICKKFPEEPYIGTYYGTEPALIIQDPELIKLVMTKEFYYFNGREVTKYKDRETVTSSMFFCTGDSWKILRQNLTPMFSSSKLKNMFYLIRQHCDTLEKVLEEETSVSSQMEAKSLATRYIMDCIGSCVFGINTNVLLSGNNKSNPFAMIGQEIFNTSISRGLKIAFRSMWPGVFYGLRFRLFPAEIDFFFHKTMTEVFQSRACSETLRNDFVDLVLSWKRKSYLQGSSMTQKSEESKAVSLKINDNLLVAQCVLLFGGGFETSSSLISFVLFELAKDKEAQAKVIKEIDDYLLKHSEVEYDCINELPYLEACLDETMRMYPLFGVITREAMGDYMLPSGLRLEKGLRIHIPVYHLHHDSKYFPQPETFRPERFCGEEKKNIIPFTFLPFGEGPRICIGMRFSKMQVTPAFLTIFKNFEIELAEGMPTKIDIVPGSVVTQATGGIHLKFTKRKI